MVCKKRPSFHEIYMRLALDIARRSTCARLQVGCVISNGVGTQVYSIGYNGNYCGGPNGCDSTEPGKCGCLHAEENAVIKLEYDSGKSRIAYVTHLPCKMCAKRLVNAGITEVYYHSEYRSTEALDIFKKSGIIVNQLNLEEKD